MKASPLKPKSKQYFVNKCNFNTFQKYQCAVKICRVCGTPNALQMLQDW